MSLVSVSDGCCVYLTADSDSSVKTAVDFLSSRLWRKPSAVHITPLLTCSFGLSAARLTFCGRATVRLRRKAGQRVKTKFCFPSASQENTDSVVCLPGTDCNHASCRLECALTVVVSMVVSPLCLYLHLITPHLSYNIPQLVLKKHSPPHRSSPLRP